MQATRGRWHWRAAVLILLAAATAMASATPAFARANNKNAVGFDISYPQCGGAFPSRPLFGIVGVNGGLPYKPNPCAASEYSWALNSTTETRAKASFYLNTADPGPAISTHWPSGATSPRPCSAADPWTADCAYDYGWYAAADSFGYALAVAGSGARAAPWWLDVETSNSWLDSTEAPNWAAMNIADLQGGVAYLQSQGVTRIGLYSTAYQWRAITGLDASSSSSYFSTELHDWVAGTGSLSQAKANCAASFTGAPVELAQYASRGFDADYVCP